VPEGAGSSSTVRLGFVGAGRVGKGLSLALSRAGYEIAGIAGRQDAQDVVDRADIVFLTVPDDALSDVAAGLRWRASVAAVHCSGAAQLDALATARQAGAATGGFHPLQMFADPEIAASGLARCAIAVEAEEPLAGRLLAMVTALGARPLRVPAGGRAAYHAAAHYAGPFVAALLAEAVEVWSRIGVPPDDALRALLPLVRGSVDAIEHAGLARAMAGSVARGDARTVARHIEALGGLDEKHRDFYCRLALRTIPLALDAGKLDTVRADELRARLLKGISG
jgi:predicted short-subunit dehydrogenase-like oxidoreductase (DUF2520 family)